MKEIKAIVQHSKLHKIRDALVALPHFPGMNVGEVKGCSPVDTGVERRRDAREELTEFSPKVRIEIVAPVEQVAEIVQIIRELTHTGLVGDGIVWVTPVETFYRIKEKNAA